MKKSFATILAAFLLLAPLTGCIGTPVVIGPTDDGAPDGDGGGAGELRTGLALVADISGSTAATAADEGAAQYDVTAAAVLVDERGVIRAAVVDGVRTSVKFDAAGGLTTDLTAPIPSKNELGADYGMVAYGGARAEWNVQAAAFAAYITGKTAAEVAGIAVSEGKAADADLVSSVTISIGDFQSLIAKALA